MARGARRRTTLWLAALACAAVWALPAPAAAQDEADPLAALAASCESRQSADPRPTAYEICSGEVESFDGTPLDATLTLPAKAGRRPLPLVVFLHGFLSDKGEYISESRAGTGPDRGSNAYKTVRWNNVWFAARGYAVLNYTARGHGESGGQIGLASKRLEVEDTRRLTGLLVDRRGGGLPRIDRREVAVLGGSYGGGQTWLLLTTRGEGAKRFGTWLSPEGRRVELAMAVPQYTWSDLLYSLVPNGHQLSSEPIDPATANTPLGIGKQTLIDGFIATAGSKFTPEIIRWLTRLNAGEPYDDPSDPIVPEAKRALTEDRSGFYQRRFFATLERGRGRRVPVLAAQGWTDPIFPAIEALRMYDELRRADRRYPISLYLGDFEHLTAQVKIPDMRRYHDLGTRMLDHYLRGRGSAPRRRVEAAVTNCDPQAFGPVLRARSWRKLATETQEIAFDGARTTFSPLAGDQRGPAADPVVAAQAGGRGCLETDLPPTPGIATFSAPVDQALTIAGLPRLSFKLETAAGDIELNSRLWDVAPDGTQTLVDRGAYRAVAPGSSSEVSYELFGNAWRFEAGHALMLEIVQDDSTYLRRDNFPSSASISEVRLSLPVVASGEG